MQISSVGLFMCLAVVCVDSFLPPMSFRKLTLSSSSPIIAPCVPWQQPVACSSQRNRKEVPEFGRPNVSRYEDFYTSTKFETVDADSRVLNDGQSEESTNPFFVGYEMDELALLWDVHTTNFGERKTTDPADKRSNSDEETIPELLSASGDISLPFQVGPGKKLGLHELILEACREADEKKSATSDDSFPQ